MLSKLFLEHSNLIFFCHKPKFVPSFGVSLSVNDIVQCNLIKYVWLRSRYVCWCWKILRLQTHCGLCYWGHMAPKIYMVCRMIIYEKFMDGFSKVPNRIFLMLYVYWRIRWKIHSVNNKKLQIHKTFNENLKTGRASNEAPLETRVILMPKFCRHRWHRRLS